MLGADAAEIVQMAAIALRLGATKADFNATVALNPTLAEELDARVTTPRVGSRPRRTWLSHSRTRPSSARL